jgi:hypothetical protein
VRAHDFEQIPVPWPARQRAAGFEGVSQPRAARFVVAEESPDPMTLRTSLYSALIIASALGVVPGCAKQAAQSPAGAPGAQPSDKLAELEAKLQEGEERLNAAIGLYPAPAQQAAPPPTTPAAPPAAGAPAPGPPPPPPAEPGVPSDEFEDDSGFRDADTSYDAEVQSAPASAPAAAPPPQQKRTRTPSPCEEGCEAFASMRRAAARICRLTGDGTPRCTRAEQRVAAARERLTHAGCGCRAK